MIRLTAAFVISASILTAMPAFAQSAGPATPAAMREMASKKAGALVTIKFILKSEGDDVGMFGGGGDQEMEVTGTMIDGAGLVLVSNTEMGGLMARFARMGMGGTSTPTDIKVLVGEDTQGAEAKLIARDSELDLAWVRVNTPPQTPYEFIDLSHAAEPKVGDYLYSVSRMGKFFDRAAIVDEARVSGTTKKPRELFFASGGGMTSLGLPVFDAEGKLVGISTMIMPNEDEMEGAAQGMFGGMRDMMSGAVLPANEVVEATKKAKESAAEAAKAEPAKDEKAPK